MGKRRGWSPVERTAPEYEHVEALEARLPPGRFGAWKLVLSYNEIWEGHNRAYTVQGIGLRTYGPSAKRACEQFSMIAGMLHENRHTV